MSKFTNHTDGIPGPQGPAGETPDLSSYSGDILPALDNTYVLGNSSYRWKAISVGDGTIYITDAVTGNEAGITVSDGVFFINGVAQAQLPNLQVTNLTFADDTTQTTAAVPQVNSDWNATSGVAQILNKPAISTFESVRWTPSFTATGLTFTGSGSTHPTYNSYYVKQGQLVSFWIAVDCATVTSFGTGQLNLQLPFAPLAGTMNHFSGWVFVDETANPDLAGHIIVNADHLPNTQTLDLHYIKQQGGANSPVMEAMLKQNTPVVLTANTNIYVNGTYISAS